MVSLTAPIEPGNPLATEAKLPAVSGTWWNLDGLRSVQGFDLHRGTENSLDIGQLQTAPDIGSFAFESLVLLDQNIDVEISDPAAPSAMLALAR